MSKRLVKQALQLVDSKDVVPKTSKKTKIVYEEPLTKEGVAKQRKKMIREQRRNQKSQTAAVAKMLAEAEKAALHEEDNTAKNIQYLKRLSSRAGVKETLRKVQPPKEEKKADEETNLDDLLDEFLANN
eukprot:Colp12_sorted_trinity150504_noHs@6395